MSQRKQLNNTVLVLKPDGTVTEKQCDSYAIKDILREMKSPKFYGDKIGDPHILCSINVDIYMIYLLGWIEGDVKNDAVYKLISIAENRITFVKDCAFYDDIVIIRTTMSTKLTSYTKIDYDKTIKKMISTNKLINISNTHEESDKHMPDLDEDDVDDDNEDEDVDDEDNDDNEDEDDEDNDDNEDEDVEDEEGKDDADDADGKDDDAKDSKDDVEEIDADDGKDNDDDVDDVDDGVNVKRKKATRKKLEIDIASLSDMLKMETIGHKYVLNQLRKDCIEIIKKVIPNHNDAILAEQGVYNYSIQGSYDDNIIPRWDNKVFKSKYVNRIRSIYTNLKADSYVGNVNYGQRFSEKEILPQDLAKMKPDEVFPELWKEIKENEYRKNHNLYMTKPVSMTDDILCTRCKKREIIYFEAQTRSADEPMTLFITCINCGKKWTRSAA